MSRISALNSFTTRNLISGFEFVGEYDTVINIAEVNINFTGELGVPLNGVEFIYEWSNDQVNVAETSTEMVHSNVYYEPFSSRFSFFRVRFITHTIISNCSLATIFKTQASFAQPAQGVQSISATNGDAITVTDGGMNVNLTIGDEITVSGTVAVSNLPATLGQALSANSVAVVLPALQINTLTPLEAVFSKGEEPQFQFYATPLTNTSAVYSDGALPVNVNGGWLYVNNGAVSGLNKINWYCYSNTLDQAVTAKKIGSIVSMYAVIYQKTLTVAPADSKNPHFVFYTLPDAGVNRSWYKNRYVFTNYALQSSVVGLKLLYIGADNPLIHPEITTRIQLIIDPVTSTNTLIGGANEDLWLGSIQTSSAQGGATPGPMPAGEYNFVFSEYGIDFTEEALLPTILPIIGGKVQVAGTVAVTGVSTETTLSAINLKTPSLGQQAAGASQPVVLTALQLAALTPLTSVAVTGSVSVSNFPATQPVSGTFYPATQVVSGDVSVSNFPAFPATQPVSGEVSVSNFPAFPASQAVSGSVSVSNFPAFPASQAVSGAVSVSNFPAFPVTQAVSGNVGINNFTPQASSNVYLASQLIIGNWYKVEAVDELTSRVTWASMGALIGNDASVLRPPVGRVFKANATGSGLSTFSPLIYSSNINVSVSSDGLTDLQLRATPVAISGDVGITGAVSLPTNASTETTLTAINLKIPTIGQKTTALSSPVCLPSQQLDVDPTVNELPVSVMTLTSWYKVVSLGTTTQAQWVNIGAVYNTETGLFPPIGRVFKCSATNPASAGQGTVSILLYRSEVTLGNSINNVGQVVLQSVSANQISVTQVVVGQWYTLQNPGNTTLADSLIYFGGPWVTYRIYKCIANPGSTTVTGLVSTLLYNEDVVVKSSPGLTDAQLRLTPVPVSGNVGITGAVSLPTNASTETTLALINNKTAALGQALASASSPVCLPADQISALYGISSSINTVEVTKLQQYYWYKVESIGTTSQIWWSNVGANLGASHPGGIPPIGWFFKAISSGQGTGTCSRLLIDNVPVFDYKVQVALPTNAATQATLVDIFNKTPALGQQLAAASQPVVLTAIQLDALKPLATQPVSLSNPEIDPIPNTISVSLCESGFWYKVEQHGTTTDEDWVILGTHEPIIGRVFKCQLETYPGNIQGTGEVSILPYFTSVASSNGTMRVEMTGVQTVRIGANQDPPFTSNNVGNTGIIVTDNDCDVNTIVLQKTDNVITYVYIYNKAEELPTSADTPFFTFIVKDTSPLILNLNQRFTNGVSIRATSDLNGTSSPLANTLFVNITNKYE